MNPLFAYHARMMSYDFGPGHPLKPVRLKMTVELLESFGWRSDDPGLGEVADVERVHSPEYVEVVRTASVDASGVPRDELYAAGFGAGDNPASPGMFEASLAYVAGSAMAARAVRDGASLAFGIAGGLHHARRAQASGFCVFNDCAVACSILRERFQRVAYIDIDVHHGDGVQWIFYEDPSVLTCSIHQDGRTLYPGTGGVEEMGAEGSSVNVPLMPGTTGDTWLWAFQEGILPFVDRFQPQAIVLQMGCDAHETDPLARIRCTVQEWLEAVQLVRDLHLPIVALGGGGYDLNNVSRMWTAACLTLAEPKGGTNPVVPAFFDASLPEPREQGREAAEAAVRALHRLHAL